MNGLGATVLVLATIATGLTAGVFWIYGNSFMPGLRATDDRTFVGAFQSIDRAIINPWFIGGGFFGALILTAVAAACISARTGARRCRGSSPRSCCTWWS